MPIHNLTKYYNHVSVRESPASQLTENELIQKTWRHPACAMSQLETRHVHIVSLDKHFVLLRYLQYIYSVAAMNCLTLRVNVGLNKTYIDTSLHIYYKILDITLQYLFL